MKSAFAQRQIPTLLGIAVLIAALVGGVFLMQSDQFAVFAPRATAQTTPKNIKITNIKDTSFTVSFLTDDATAGFVKYGKTPADLKTQAGDDRDQLSGTVEQFTSHYITVRDLDADTEYHFTLGTGSVPKFDNEGTPFTVKTAKKGGSPTAAKTIYGTVNNSNGTAAEGAIVYMSSSGAGELSALVRAQGSWAIPLSTARTADLASYMNFTNDTAAQLVVQGAKVSEGATVDITIGQAQPVPPIVLVSSTTSTRSEGEPPATQAEVTPVESEQPVALINATEDSPSPSPEASATASATPRPTPSPTVVENASASATATASASPRATTQIADTVDLTSSKTATVDTTQPVITGRAAPNSIITIEVHSENEITSQVQTDAQGNFTFPLSGSDTELEPGEHTVTITYTDPITKRPKTETKTFYVADTATSGTGSSRLLAQANTASPSPTPFGTENPYTIPSPSPTPKLSPSPTATASAKATASASPRLAMPSTNSAIPKAGSVGMTFALVFGGFCMILAGVWSYTQAQYAEEDDGDSD